MSTHHGSVFGTPVSPGICTARAQVSARSELAICEPGAILVARVLPRDLVHVLGLIGGLICEAGGASGIVTTLARELHVPAIVGAADACNRINDGDVVTMDGSTGIARVTGPEIVPTIASRR